MCECFCLQYEPQSCFCLQTLYDDGAETTRKQLVGSCLSLQIANEACLDSLIDVWRRVVRRVYHYYQLSAKAYFTYLNLNGKVNKWRATRLN